jgi:hypothetical protein
VQITSFTQDKALKLTTIEREKVSRESSGEWEFENKTLAG